MPVRINLDENNLGMRFDEPFTETGMEMLASQILRDCNFYCKQDTTMLIDSSLIHSDLKHGVLRWQTPYAARQYYEIRTAYTDVNPNASWRWCEVAKQAHQDEWKRMASAIVRRYGG